MSKPIPRNLLIHSATLRHVTGRDVYGNETYAETVLSYVRFEPNIKTILSDLGEGKNDKYLMIWDSVNSIPSGTVFANLDKIVYDGVELTIREVFKASDERALHHLEIYLT